MKINRLYPLTAALLFTTAQTYADQVFLDDVIIDGSLAVGLDSVNGENFGFDTLRLKENNLRFHFDDTSVAAAFPRNDWRIIANDSTNGGDSYLGIEDTTGGRIPFRVEAGASSNALFVESTGDVGFGTNNPVVRMHASDGDTPTLRLEQNGTSGWNPQSWDVAGNETNFFIRDVTHGSKLPFRIRPDAPTSSIEIEADGNVQVPYRLEVGSSAIGGQNRIHVANAAAANADDVVVSDTGVVGIGTAAPAVGAKLHIANAAIDNTDDVVVTTGGSIGIGTIAPAAGVGLHIVQTGNETVRMTNSSGGTPANFMSFYDTGGRTGYYGFVSAGSDEMWFASETGDCMVLSTAVGARSMEIDPAGNVSTLGTVNGVSDRNAKRDIVPVDGGKVLEKVLGLPISEWTYKAGDPSVRHVGPMAQDFRASFGLGKDDKTISFHDPAGVALAAIQGLNGVVEEKSRRIDELEKQNAALEARRV